MDRIKIIVLSAALIFLSVRLYQKYIKKGKDKTKYGSDTYIDANQSSSTKEDDYEPYSKNNNK